MNGMAAIILLIILLAWRMLVLGNCTYLVFWQGHSGWWFVLAILLCSGSVEK